MKERMFFLYSRMNYRIKTLRGKLRASKFGAIKKKHVLLAALVFFSLSLLIGFVPLSFKAFNETVKDILIEAGADSVSVERVRVNVFGSAIRLDNLFMYKRKNAREHYTVEVSQIDIRGNVIALGFLIFGRPKSAKPKNEEAETPPRDIFTEVYGQPVELIGEAFAALWNFDMLNEIRLLNASVIFFERNKAKMSAQDASARLQRRSKFFSADINVKKAKMPYLGAEIENIKIKIRSDGDKLEAYDVKGEVYGGNFSAQASLDLKDFSILGGTLRAQGVNIGQFWRETAKFSGSVSGQASFNVEILQGKAINFESVKLRGDFLATQVTATRLPLQNVSLIRRFSLELSPLSFERITGEFVFLNGRIDFSQMAGRGDVMNFSSTGWFNLENGRMHKNFQGEFTQTYLPRLPRLVRNSLERTETGGRFYCVISGTFESPQVRIGRSLIRRGIRNVFRR